METDKPHDEPPQLPDPIRELLEKQRREHEERVKEQDTLMASQEYQQEVKYSSRFTWDFLNALRICWFYSSRGGSIYDNSVVIRSTDDLVQSTLAASALLRNGMHTPIKRELRYIIESSVKNLYVDQQMEARKPLPSLVERLDFLHDHVDRSSIDVREHLQLAAFDGPTRKQFIDELNDVYRDCCAYVHPSRRQIEERLDLADQGRSSGFETAEELRGIARLMFRIYDMALTLYFHAFGLSMTGDVFINAFDDRPDWKFHKGKYVKLVSAHFDYKAERKSRKGS